VGELLFLADRGSYMAGYVVGQIFVVVLVVWGLFKLAGAVFGGSKRDE